MDRISSTAGATGSLFRIRLNLPLEIMPMLNDLIRMACIQFVAQFMFYMMNSGEAMFSVMFVQTLCFLLLGVLVYWLIIHKLVRIETTQFPKAVSVATAAAAAAIENVKKGGVPVPVFDDDGQKRDQDGHEEDEDHEDHEDHEEGDHQDGDGDHQDNENGVSSE